jgi:hypothetical protein
MAMMPRPTSPASTTARFLIMTILLSRRSCSTARWNVDAIARLAASTMSLRQFQETMFIPPMLV